MITDDQLNSIYDRLLVESEQEDAGDADDNAESLVLRVEDSEESEYEDNDDDLDAEWSDNVVPYERWIFDDSKSGVDQQLLLGCTEPKHFYELFMTGIWDLIVNETNRYGQEKDPWWEPTTVDEMKRFVGLCLQMGVVRLPRFSDYWSSSPAFGCNPIGPQVMPKDRFGKILARLHFANNSSYNGQDKLYNISPLVELINRNCKRISRPGKNVCIDDCFVPVRVPVEFRQSTEHKKCSYGIKLLKLCATAGYTHRILVCDCMETSRNFQEVAESLVMKLMDDLLDEGRHLYTGNRYTTISLADNLLQRKTNLIGLCRHNGKGLPRQVIRHSLKRGHIKAQQKKNGVMVLKWRNRRNIVVMSTVHDATTSNNSSKPKVIESYDEAKLFENTNDQISSYSPYVKKSTKWYIRLFFYVVTQTCLINAWTIYCEKIQKISIDDFKAQVYLSLMQIDGLQVFTPASRHVLEQTGPVSKTRRRCVGCYRKIAKYHDSKSAGIRTKQVTTRCSQCRKHYCLDCFNNVHKKCILE